MWVYHHLRPLLFKLEPESVHNLTIDTLAFASELPGLLRLLRLSYGVNDQRLSTRVFGLTFPSPIGLAAGMDKNAAAIPAFLAMGFGFCEIGSVTAQPQTGNPRPRLFRLPHDQAIINRMGFNNIGAAAVAKRLAALRQSGVISAPLGINLGKSKVTPLADAPQDYIHSLNLLYPYGDYFVINVSSPNTPGLRELQDRQHLDTLLAQVMEYISGQQIAKPLLLKIAPELSRPQLDDVIELCLERGVSGIIATNTTTERRNLRTVIDEAGGLSGRPLGERALEVLSYLHRQLQGQLPLVSVGGITTSDDVIGRFQAGASLVQLYTALVYEGPGLMRRMSGELLAWLEREGLPTLKELQHS
jgi:dihydroorotate dehydrogenase